MAPLTKAHATEEDKRGCTSPGDVETGNLGLRAI